MGILLVAEEALTTVPVASSTAMRKVNWGPLSPSHR